MDDLFTCSAFFSWVLKLTNTLFTHQQVLSLRLLATRLQAAYENQLRYVSQTLPTNPYTKSITITIPWLYLTLPKGSYTYISWKSLIASLAPWLGAHTIFKRKHVAWRAMWKRYTIHPRTWEYPSIYCNSLIVVPVLSTRTCTQCQTQHYLTKNTVLP